MLSREHVRKLVIQLVDVAELYQLYRLERNLIREEIFKKGYLEITIDYKVGQVPEKVIYAELTCEHADRTHCQCVIKSHCSFAYSPADLRIHAEDGS